jgi:hypothetical protein
MFVANLRMGARTVEQAAANMTYVGGVRIRCRYVRLGSGRRGDTERHTAGYRQASLTIRLK